MSDAGARGRWAWWILGAVVLAAVLVLWLTRPGKDADDGGNLGGDLPTTAPSVSPIAPVESPTASKPDAPVSTTLNPPDPDEPSLPNFDPVQPGETVEAVWVTDTDIRVVTYGSSSCPARFVETEVLAPDLLLVRFDARYDRPCTADYGPKVHQVSVPPEADGRPLNVRFEIEGG